MLGCLHWALNLDVTGRLCNSAWVGQARGPVLGNADRQKDKADKQGQNILNFEAALSITGEFFWKAALGCGESKRPKVTDSMLLSSTIMLHTACKQHPATHSRQRFHAPGSGHEILELML